MSAAFTPGPWEWNEGGRLFHNVPGSHSSNVLVIHDPVWRPMPADANLIAAAPELYEALVECRETFAFYVRHHEAKLRMSSDSGEQSNLQDKIYRNQQKVALCDAAIAKARGEQA